MAFPEPAAPAVDVVELNPYAPRPFVFTEVAICLRESIAAAGWTSAHRVNEADPNAISVVLGALPPFSPLVAALDPRRTLIANFEQLASTSVVSSPEYQNWLRDWVVVDYHSLNVEHLKRRNGSAQRTVELPFIPSPALALGLDPEGERTVDVVFFGSPNERRAAVLQQLREAGLSVEVVSGAYGMELAPAVRRARVVLHVHFYETGLFPVTRVLQPVASGVPVVCEASVFSRLSDWSRSGILFAPYEELVEACRHLAQSPQEQHARADSARAFASKLDFAHAFRGALKELGAPPLDAPANEPDPERPLSDEEIEAILEREAAVPSEATAVPAQIPLAMREPGQGRFGRWIVWLLIAFSIWTVWQSMR